MRVPSRAVLLAAMTSGALLSGTATALAQDDDGSVADVFQDVDCATVESELLGECDEEVPPPGTPPAGDNGGGDNGGVSDTGTSDDTTGGSSDDGEVVTGDDGSDDDNGSAPVGGIETGAGGTADDRGAAPVALAGGALVAAGGMTLASRTRGRHVRRGRHAL
jgi:hypothetical protein